MNFSCIFLDMQKKNTFIKKIGYTLPILWMMFSISFAATTDRGREIVNLLEDDWRTDVEIRQAITDLWYNANEYLWKNTNSNIKVITNTSSTNYNTNSSETSPLWRNIISKLKNDWRTDTEIKDAIEDLWYDSSAYFPSTNNNTSYTSQTQYSNSSSVYVSRSCKPYNIEYIDYLNVYSSPDLKKKEYFINVEYFKRYIDSKNVWNAECNQNNNRISTSYTDNSWNPDRFIAPNWKVYFIVNSYWSYTSNELSTAKSFSTINELKNYIRSRNPLISMWTQVSQIQPSQTELLYQTVHWSATEEYNTISSNEYNFTGSIETTPNEQTENNINNNQNQTESSTEASKDSNVISTLRNALF